MDTDHNTASLVLAFNHTGDLPEGWKSRKARFYAHPQSRTIQLRQCPSQDEVRIFIISHGVEKQLHVLRACRRGWWRGLTWRCARIALWCTHALPEERARYAIRVVQIEQANNKREHGKPIFNYHNDIPRKGLAPGGPHKDSHAKHEAKVTESESLFISTPPCHCSTSHKATKATKH